jgi:hemerythrin-like domain-containing protein
MLRAHIQKEDQILYPLAERAIPRDAMARMDDEFSAPAAGGDSLRALAERLLADYAAGDAGR